MSGKKAVWTPPRILAVGFAAIILLGAFLLRLPISSTGEPLTFLDALFTATSATCVTGLVVVDTGTRFTMFGQVVILLLIQIGGLGFMSTATLIAMLLKKKISLKERLVLQQAMNQGQMEGIVRLIQKVLIYSLVIEFIGALLLTARFSLDMDFPRAAYFGVFHSISIFNNAGFDLFGDFRSLTAYTNDLLINVVSIGLIVLGGLGFIVLSDLIEVRRWNGLSLHTKLVLSTSFGLIALGAVVIFIFEFTNPRTFGALNGLGKTYAALFQSVTPRSGGVSTIDIGAMRQASQFFIVLLMFIGASPGSTGGGIKTTTFATLVGALIAMIRGREDVVFFGYRLAKERVYKAITLTLLALIFVTGVTMFLSTTEDAHFLKIMFEATSAFTTTGLSMGLTPDLSPVGKLVIIATMFIGRLGPITLAYALNPKQEKPLFQYPEGKIMIG